MALVFAKSWIRHLVCLCNGEDKVEREKEREIRKKKRKIIKKKSCFAKRSTKAASTPPVVSSEKPDPEPFLVELKLCQIGPIQPKQWRSGGAGALSNRPNPAKTIALNSAEQMASNFITTNKVSDKSIRQTF